MNECNQHLTCGILSPIALLNGFPLRTLCIFLFPAEIAPFLSKIGQTFTIVSIVNLTLATLLSSQIQSLSYVSIKFIVHSHHQHSLWIPFGVIE